MAILAACLIVFVATLFATMKVKDWWKKCLPGPYGLPIVGHLPFINLRLPHLTFTEWTKKYGKIFQVNFGGQRMTIVNSYETIREMLLRREFNGRPDLLRINTYRQMGGFGFSEPNLEWKTLRKAALHGIRSYGHGMERMDRILGIISGVTEDKMHFHAGQEKAFDPWKLVYGHMLRSITAFTLGEHVKPSEELYRVVEKLDALALDVLNPAGPGALLDTLPWLRHLGHPMWAKCKQLVATRDEMWKLVSGDICNDLDSASIAHYFWKAHRDDIVDGERVKCAVGDMMIAGTLTTTISTYCLMRLLAEHPQIQQRLYNECQGAPLHLDSLQQMPYMRAVMFELQRYISINPLGLPHTCVEETTLAGVTIPVGTNILPNIWSVHHDPDFWTDPENFRPERFLTEDGELVPADHPFRRRILAFGLGPRLCPGANFANNRIFMFTSTLLQQFKLTADPKDSDGPFQPWTYNLTLALEPNHYRVTLTPHPRNRRQSMGKRPIGEK